MMHLIWLMHTYGALDMITAPRWCQGALDTQHAGMYLIWLMHKQCASNSRHTEIWKLWTTEIMYVSLLAEAQLSNSLYQVCMCVCMHIYRQTCMSLYVGMFVYR